jgi:hypothetical protein
MDTDTIHTCRLSEDELGQFTRMHRRMLPIRNKNFKNLHIKNKQIKDNLQPILDKSFSVLRSNNIDDFDNTTYHMEFHQRNCGFEKKKVGTWFDWHKDDSAATKYRVYSVLFYIRKDIAVKGGDIDFRIGEDIYTHTITTGDIVQFKGDILHRPQEATGFGCRDLIVVFVKRNK